MLSNLTIRFSAKLILMTVIALAATLQIAQAARYPGPSTRLSLSIASGDREVLNFEGMVAAYAAVRNRFGESAKLDDVTVVDYATYGSAGERGLEGRHAFYLIQPAGVRGSSDPLNIVAFSTRKAAARQQQRVGGNIVTFEDAWNAAQQLYETTNSSRVAEVKITPVAENPEDSRVNRARRPDAAECNT